MKRILLLSVLFLAAALGDAMADCRGTRVTDIQAALENKFVCAARATGGNNDTWSEEHGNLSVGGTGILTEYAKGPGDPVDPRKAVGTWAVGTSSFGATVIYSYTGDSGSPYTWSLFQIPSTSSYYFCQADGSSLIAFAKITDLPVNSSNPCPARQ
jgi:hypothetical protein